MVRQSMIRGAHTETHHGTAKEARKDQHIRRIGRLIARMNHQIQPSRGDDGNDGAGEMRPDVDEFVVQVEERAGGLGVGRAGGPVAGEDEGVVAAPGGEVVPEEEELLLDFLLDLFDG